MRKRHRQQGSDVNHRCLYHSLIGYRASRIPCLHVLWLALSIRKSRYANLTSKIGNQQLVLVHLHFGSTASSIRLSTSGPSPRFNTTMSSRFLALPAELRQRIYTFIFQGPAVIRDYTPEQKRRYLSRSQPEDEQPQGYRANYEILLTNKLTFVEALELYYYLTTVKFSVCELVHMPMTFYQLSRVRSIQLDECCWMHYKWTAHDGAGLEDILPRLQQFSKLETIGLPTLMDIDESDHANCFGQQATEHDLEDGFTSDEVYGEFVEAMIVALPQTMVYVKAMGVIAIADGRGSHEKTMVVSANYH